MWDIKDCHPSIFKGKRKIPGEGKESSYLHSRHTARERVKGKMEGYVCVSYAPSYFTVYSQKFSQAEPDLKSGA